MPFYFLTSIIARRFSHRRRRFGAEIAALTGLCKFVGKFVGKFVRTLSLHRGTPVSCPSAARREALVLAYREGRGMGGKRTARMGAWQMVACKVRERDPERGRETQILR
jgi:hypothetical protein